MPNKRSQSQADESYEKVGEFVLIYLRGKTWYVNYQHDDRQVRRSLKTRSKKEARRRLLMIEKELLAGEHKLQRQAPSIEEVVQQYIEHLRAEGRTEKTISKYLFAFAILQAITERRKITRISQLDATVFDAFRTDRVQGNDRRRPAGPKTLHHDSVLIRQLVNFAIRRGMIDEDPLRGLKIEKPKRAPQPCWTRQQVDQILSATKSPQRDVLTFLAETGTHIGEAKWLTWEDVDFDRGLIHIRPKGDWQPKSGDQRAVPMSDRLREMLSATPRNGRWVFTARPNCRNREKGRQISERRLLQYLKRVLKRLGLRGHLHTFRHSFISFASISGVPERVLRQWIGHVDREILDWYFHLADSQSQEAMKKLSDAAEQNKPNNEEDQDEA